MISFYNTLTITPEQFSSGAPYCTVPTVSHAGDVGDTLAALASFQRMFPLGVHLLLYRSTDIVRESYTPDKVQRLASFLELQPYIRSVRFAEHPVGIVLDAWRKHKTKQRLNLADYFATWAGVSHPDREAAWLRVDKPEHVADIVIHRSPRYHGYTFPWHRIVKSYSNRLVMVGSLEEHSNFCNAFGEVKHHPTPTYLDLARAIAGAKLFIGNQSSPYWCALGLGQRTWLEQNKSRMHNCHWQRERAMYDNRKLPVV